MRVTTRPRPSVLARGQRVRSGQRRAIRGGAATPEVVPGVVLGVAGDEVPRVTTDQAMVAPALPGGRDGAIVADALLHLGRARARGEELSRRLEALPVPHLAERRSAELAGIDRQPPHV